MFYDPKKKNIVNCGSSRACGCNHNKISIHAEQNAINFCREKDKHKKYEIVGKILTKNKSKDYLLKKSDLSK